MHTLRRPYGALATAAASFGLCLSGNTIEPKDIMAFGAGPFVVRPHLQVAEQYNDNLFYNSSGPQIDDFITVVSPSVDIQVGRGGRQASLGVGYAYSHLFYTQNPYVNDASMHRVTVGGAYRGEKLQFDLSASAMWANTIYGGYESFMLGGFTFLFRAPNVERVSYSLAPKVTYSLSEKTSIYSSLSLSGMDFHQVATSFYDVNSWNWGLGAGYKFRPKISAVTEMFYGQSATSPNQPLFAPKPPKPPHLETFGGLIGARGEITPRISGSLKFGYQQNYYGDESFGDPIYAGDLAWAISEKSQVSLNYRRASSASVQSASAYTSDNVGLQFQQSIGTRRPWILNAGATYGHNQYAGGNLNESTDYFGFNCGVAYQIKLWLKTGLNYQFTKSSSESKSFIDYEVNEVMISVSLGY